MHHDITGAAHTNTDLMVEHIKTIVNNAEKALL
jgi:hypothetical protein